MKAKLWFCGVACAATLGCADVASDAPLGAGWEADVDSGSAGVTLHSQEGPGLINWWRRTPIQQTQRQWVAGMLNLYNDVSNGFGWHAWPPSWTDKNEGMGNYTKPPGGVYDETDTLDILETALRGDHVANP